MNTHSQFAGGCLIPLISQRKKTRKAEDTSHSINPMDIFKRKSTKSSGCLIDQLVEEQWVKNLWQSKEALDGSSEFLERLLYNIGRLQGPLQPLSQNGSDAGTPRRDSVLSEALNSQVVIDSYGALRQWLGSALPGDTPAIDSLCQPKEHFQSWAESFMAAPKYFTVDQTDFRYLCQMLLDSGHSVEEECYSLFLRIESIHSEYVQSCTSNSQPNSLRKIIALRILEISENCNSQENPKGILSVETEVFEAIPVSILDVPLSSNQTDFIEKALPQISDSKTRELYRGISIKACAFCQKLKFDALRSDVCPLFRNLTEFPQIALGDNCAYHRTVCSSCRFKCLVRDICQEWWHDLASPTWLKARCNRSCPMSRSWKGIRDVEAYILQFNSVDSEDLQRCISLYRQVLQYRYALRELKPRPQPQDLVVAQRLVCRFLDIGLMHNFISPETGPERPKIAQTMTVTVGSEWLRAPSDSSFQVPLFLNMFKRQSISKECIVCAEDKFEIDYDSRSRWTWACAEFRGPWMWTVFEYPCSDHQRCTHSLDVCRLCIAKHVAISLENGNFEHITCPQCDRNLTYDEIRNLCPEETFRVYDKRVLRDTLGKLPNFRWCLSPQCESGQVYDDISPVFPIIQCRDCDFQMCFYHHRPWHNDLTCDEFDSSLTHGDPKYQETQSIIENQTKGCPSCRVRIEKGSGCFHMTCSSCKHEFCWECLVSWQLVRSNRLNHDPGCYFYSSDLAPTTLTGTDLQTALQQRR